MNFVNKLIDKIYVDKTFLKLGLYETQCIVKLCVSETAKEIKQKLSEWNNKPEDSSLCFQTNQICDNLISKCEVNHAE